MTANFNDDIFIDTKSAQQMMNDENYIKDKPLYRCGNCGDVSYNQQLTCKSCGKQMGGL